YGMGMIVWSPLDAGFLSGKYRSLADLTEDTRIVSSANRYGGGFDPDAEFIRRKLELIAQLDALAKEAGITLAQMAIAFTIEHPAVTSAIIGPRVMEHLET